MSEFDARAWLDLLAAEFRGNQCEFVRDPGQPTILRLTLTSQVFDVVAQPAHSMPDCAEYAVLTGHGPKVLAYSDAHSAARKLREIALTDEPPKDWDWWRTLHRADTGTGPP